MTIPAAAGDAPAVADSFLPGTIDQYLSVHVPTAHPGATAGEVRAALVGAGFDDVGEVAVCTGPVAGRHLAGLVSLGPAAGGRSGRTGRRADGSRPARRRGRPRP